MFKITIKRVNPNERMLEKDPQKRFDSEQLYEELIVILLRVKFFFLVKNDY